MVERSDLNVEERRAVESLEKLAKKWPKSLSLFSNSGTLEVHKNGNSEPYTDDTYIDSILGISNDGGDRD